MILRRLVFTVSCTTLLGLGPSQIPVRPDSESPDLDRSVSSSSSPAGTFARSVGFGQAVQGSAVSIPLVVDGANTPESVPDDIAYYHFIMATAATANPSTEEVARRARELDRVGLSNEDSAALVAALAGVREGLNEIDVARHVTGSVETEPKLRSLKERETALLEDARTRLLSTLSARGLARVESYVQEEVKRHIRIYEM
jgi:hypothetical protein